MNDDHFPNWILPGSEAIMPKASTPLNLWDDERDVNTGIIHNKAIYDPSRELYLQTSMEGPPLDPNPQGQAHWTSNNAISATFQPQARNTELRFPVTRQFGH